MGRILSVPAASWSWMTALLGPFLHPGGEALSGRVLERARLRPSGLLLDLGCGGGATLALARRRDPSIQAIGIDEGPLPSGGGQLPESRLRADGSQLPFRSNRVDAVVSECSLCLMRPFQGALREVHRVLRPGGRLVFSDFYATERLTWSSRELAVWACLLDLRGPQEMLEALEGMGFADVRLEGHAEALWEMEERIQSKVDAIGLVETLAVRGDDSFWSDAARFLREAREARDAGRLRYGIFEATKPSR